MGICHLVFGQLGHRVLNFTMILGYISALVSYLITIGNLTASVMTTLVDNVNERGNINWLTRPMFMSIMITLIFIFPICMIRRYGHMAWISKCSIFLVIISGKVKYISTKESKRCFTILMKINIEQFSLLFSSDQECQHSTLPITL